MSPPPPPGLFLPVGMGQSSAAGQILPQEPAVLVTAQCCCPWQAPSFCPANKITASVASWLFSGVLLLCSLATFHHRKSDRFHRREAKSARRAQASAGVRCGARDSDPDARKGAGPTRAAFKVPYSKPGTIFH